MFMMSSGGLTSATLFAGKDAILSGPAGGVVAMARTGASAGFKRVIGFDMGGTSTDVAHFDGEFERAFETEVAGVRMRAPMMKIHTVAAGGGSILSFDGARFRVGPASAGADPGPACYRRGGPLTVTDANLMTGKLIPDLFPKVFGPRGDEPLDDGNRARALCGSGARHRRRAERRGGRRRISCHCGRQDGRGDQDDFGRARLRRDALRAQLLRRRGRPARLRRRRRAGDFDRPHPSVLVAALGLWHGARRHRAPSARKGSRSRFASSALLRVSAVADQLADAAVAEVEGQGVAREAIKVHRRAQLRYSGSDTTIEVPLSTPAAMRRAFERAHKSRFGFVDRAKAIAIEAVSAEAVGGAARLHRADPSRPSKDGVCRRPIARQTRASSAAPPVPARATRFFSHGRWREANVFLREALPVGAGVDGPALIIEPHQTIVVEQGWRAAITAEKPCAHDPRRADAAARGDRRQGRSGDARDLQPSLHVDRRADGRDAAEHRLFGQHQGAARLLLRRVRPRGPPRRQRPAHAGASRLDGSLGRDDHPRQRGAHPPGRRVRAQRALQRRHPSARHHRLHAGVRRARRNHLVLDRLARPSRRYRRNSARIDESARDFDPRGGGVYIDNFLLVDRGRFRERELYDLLKSGPYPARNPLQNVNDLKAQIAANARRACGNSSAWSRRSRFTRSRPIWATFRTTPTKACAA